MINLPCSATDKIHPYSITMVHADLQDNKVILKVTTNAEDLLYFHKLAFDSLFRIPGERLRVAAQFHAETIRSGIYILDQHKKRLSSTFRSADLTSIQNISNADVMSLLKYPLYYTLEIKLGPDTDLLEFHQDLGSAGLPAVSVLTILKTGNVLIQNIELAKDKPFTLVRDAQYVKNSEANTFMLSYITLSDTRVIHELTIPQEILSSFLLTTLQEQDTSLNAIRKFIKESSTVVINKRVLEPQITALLQQKDNYYQHETSSMVHVRIEYSLRDMPRDVTIVWENFNWKMRWFKAMIDAFGDSKEHNFSRFQPTFNVHREVKVKQE